MQHFFVPPDSIFGENFILRNPETVHQIRKVLRMRIGEKILLLDNSGAEFLSEIEQIDRKEITLKILERRENRNEAQIEINLFQGLPNSPAKFEEILRHATEIGIARFFPVISERSETRKLKNLERLEKILRESAEQSERAKIPTLAEIAKFKDIWGNLPEGLNLVADSFSRKPLLAEILPQLRGEPVLNLFVGPEGGFSEKEIKLANTNEAITFSLGPRILRTETASVAITSAILFS